MLKNRHVELIRYTPEPEKLVASAAKLCYSKSGIDKIESKLTDEGVERFLDMLMDLGHTSTIEHIQYSFGIEGVSRVLTHQLVRHRIGSSYSQQSQRYVSLKQFDYIMPPEIESNIETKDIFEKTMMDLQDAYNLLSNKLLLKYLEDRWGNIDGNERIIIAESEDKNFVNKMKKKAIEDARYVFPNACETKIVVSMNARALLNFFEHRCCYRAQWEIRDLAWDMLSLVEKVAPNIFKNAGPKCLKGVCPEGKMSCGKMDLVRKRKDMIKEEK